jgi:hypothetical protein
LESHDVVPRLRELAEHHRQLLEASAISDDVAAKPEPPACVFCGRERGEISYSTQSEAHCCLDCFDRRAQIGLAEQPSPLRRERRPDPFDRDVDRLLRGLRDLAGEYELERVYQPIPVTSGGPDRWRALCPVHPSAGRYTLLITELPGGRADVRCSVGCSPARIRYILLGDPVRQRRAEAYAKVIVWAQQYGKRGAA